METDLKKIVGHRLQMLRMEKNLTQEQMGEKLNLSTSAYCKIEYGETDLTLTRLNKIAEVLNMSALELFNKIDGNVYVNNSGTIGTNIGVAKDCSSVHIEAADDLRELIKANSRLLDMLYKRIELLENSDYTPREIPKTMYRLSFRLPESGEERHIILGMIPEQE